MAHLDNEDLLRRLENSERKRRPCHPLLLQKEADEDTLLWSLVDLVSVLLIFFVLLYSDAITKHAPRLSEKIYRTHLSQQSAGAPQQVSAKGSARLQPYRHMASLAADVLRANQGAVSLRQEILATLETTSSHEYSVAQRDHSLVITFNERIIFNRGEAELLQSFKPILSKIAALVARKQEFLVEVSGHTDDTPISTTRFPSNWELSAIRAVNVAKFLTQNGVDPHRVSIKGYGEYQPLVANTSPANRQMNRRVEIALIKGSNDSGG
ncbi:MAG: flagellar motor protein MotB [Deltaproteobacteria bacterium]|nr:flagellar motor protein MotB [Deltaproteobacteria bacterium]